MIAHQLLSTVWNFCYVLRDDGVSCVDYIEQLTLLIFIKIMDENSKLSKKRKINLPKDLAWQSLITKQGEAVLSITKFFGLYSPFAKKLKKYFSKQDVSLPI